MDRQIIYPGAIPLETDLLNTNRNALVALGFLAQDILGQNTLVSGLACTPNSPAALNVLVAPGRIYSLQNLDATAYSSLAADTIHSLIKQGISLDTTTLSCPAPATAGYSVNYLIEASFSEVDANQVVLPYYNSSNPAQPYSGPANSGTAQYTARKGTIVLTAKAGVAAATGTQTTPAADSGNVGLWVVTVANGQTTIISGNIAQVSGAPFINNTLTLLAPLLSPALTGTPTAPTPALTDSSTKLATTAFVIAQMLGCPTSLVAGGTADALTATMASAPQTALADGMIVEVRASAANVTTAPTLNLTLGSTATGAKTIVKGALGPLAVGDIPGAGAVIEVQYNAAAGQWVLLNPGATVSLQSFRQGIVNGALQVWQRGSSFTGIAGSVLKTIFLTSPTGSVQSYTTPGDWNNSNNIVTCIGAGSGGVGTNAAAAANGGGGGAFASRTNLTLSGAISYQIGAGSSGTISSASSSAGGDTWFNAASMPASGTSNQVGAKGGAAATSSAGGVGGLAANSCGSVVYNGGTGGTSTSTANASAGGGGAAGPNGPGGNGGSPSGAGGAGGGGSGGGGSGTGGSAGSSAASGAGGNNSAGSGGGSAGGGAGSNGGGGGGNTSANAGAGGAGTDWTATAGGTAGPGGGGGAVGGVSVSPGAGGLYGGGGGGSNSNNTTNGGNGAQGLIVIQYTPTGGATYTADAWFAAAGGTSPSASVTQVPGSNGFFYGLKLQRPNANTAIGMHQVGHVIAGIDCTRFQGQTVMLSFWAKAGANFSAAGNNLSVKLYVGTGTDEGAIAMQGGIWAGSSTPINTNQALTTTFTQYSFTATIPANATEIGVLLGWTPVGTAGADDSFTIQGVALKPSSAGAGSVFDFPQYDLDLYECRTRCEVVAGYIPATTAQNIRSLHLRAVPTITGGGSGFTSTGTTKDALVAYQTAGSVQTLTLSADL